MKATTQAALTRIGAFIQIAALPVMLFQDWHLASLILSIGSSFGWWLYYYEYKRHLSPK